MASGSRFLAAPVLVTADVNMEVNLQNVEISGVGLRGSSLAVTLGRGNNTVVLKRCNVSGHEASHASPISISTDSYGPESSSVELRQVDFYGNRRLKTRGAAVSIFARSARQGVPPPQLNVSLFDCNFTDNSAADEQVRNGLLIELQNLGFYRILAPGAAEIPSFSHIRLKSGFGQKFPDLVGFEKKLPCNLTKDLKRYF